MKRTNYMEGTISHQEYYSTLARAAGIGNFQDAFIRRVRKALADGDEHLNTIPLQQWDAMCFMDYQNASLKAELSKRGDTLSLAVGVCVRKAAAKDQAATTTPAR